jgi:hypothetical protein
MKKRILIIILITALFLAPLKINAGIPIADILAFAQRVANWATKAAEWVNKIDSLHQARTWMAMFQTDNFLFNSGFKGGLDEIKILKTDIEQLDKYYKDVCDLDNNTWAAIFNDGEKLESLYPDINNYEAFRQNDLYKNNYLKEYIEKWISLQKEKLTRIEILTSLIKEVNGIEKEIIKKIKDLQNDLDKRSADTGPQHTADTAKINFNHAVVRLHTLRTRIIGNATIRTINEFHLKSQVEEINWQNYAEKFNMNETKNYDELKKE